MRAVNLGSASHVREPGVAYAAYLETLRGVAEVRTMNFNFLLLAMAVRQRELHDSAIAVGIVAHQNVIVWTINARLGSRSIELGIDCCPVPGLSRASRRKFSG